jgi:signal transduction histidine kinase
MMANRQSKILYVEDNLASRMLVKQVLEAYGYTVFEAEDGLKGIQLAQEILPDLILMDINIPGMDGHEAAMRLKSLPGLQEVPVVAVTARVMEGDRERSLAAGCDGYIPKPIDVDALPRQIAEFLEGRREVMPVAEERVYLREHSQKLVERLEEKIAELSKANEGLRRTDELKSNFISIAAHELRTPITVVHGYLGMLLEPQRVEKQGFSPDTLELLQGVSRGVERLRLIVEDMLYITRIEAGTLDLRLGPTSIANTVDWAVKKLRPFAEERRLTIRFDRLGNLPPLMADAERLRQVFFNLLSNAIKFTPDGGRVKVYGSLKKKGLGTSSSPVEGADAMVEIIIEDTGIGIDPEDQERIFEHFYEVKDVMLHSTSKTDFMGGGIGLGLPIARGIIEAHGGGLWAESECQDIERCPGSRFHVLLPVTGPDYLKQPAPGSPAAG